MYTRVPVRGHHLLRSFNGPGPGGPEATIRKWKRERLILPSLRRKPIKPSTQDLRLSRRHWVPSPGGWRHRAPSQESLRSPGRRVSQRGLCAPKNQPRRERERERKKERKKDTGTQTLMKQRCFISRNAGLFVFSKMITQDEILSIATIWID